MITAYKEAKFQIFTTIMSWDRLYSFKHSAANNFLKMPDNYAKVWFLDFSILRYKRIS